MLKGTGVGRIHTLHVLLPSVVFKFVKMWIYYCSIIIKVCLVVPKFCKKITFFKDSFLNVLFLLFKRQLVQAKLYELLGGYRLIRQDT